MNTSHEDIVSYKWDDHTYTGYLLHYDFDLAHRGLKQCYHVEEWENRTIVNDWWCTSVEEALRVLSQFFELDAQREQANLQPRFEELAAHAA